MTRKKDLKVVNLSSDVLNNAALEGFYTVNHNFKSNLHRQQIEDDTKIPFYYEIFYNKYNYKNQFELVNKENNVYVIQPKNDTDKIIIDEMQLEHIQKTEKINLKIEIKGSLYVKERRKNEYELDFDNNNENQLQITYKYDLE